VYFITGQGRVSIKTAALKTLLNIMPRPLPAVWEGRHPFVMEERPVRWPCPPECMQKSKYSHKHYQKAALITLRIGNCAKNKGGEAEYKRTAAAKNSKGPKYKPKDNQHILILP